jgi:restriction system protein
MNKKRNLRESPVARIWAIRAGRGGKAHHLFLAKGIIALADAGIGNLTKLERSRESFYTAYRKIHPDDTRTGSTGIGGKFFRFIHEVKVGDLVVYPKFHDKTVYIGAIMSEYAFDITSPFPHQRLVRWKFMIQNSEFSQALRYELGAARTFFRLKNHANELLSMIADKKVTRFRLVAKAKRPECHRRSDA